MPSTARRFQQEWRIVAAVSLVVFVLIVTNWRPWDLFARGGYSSDFYDAQAHTFWHGHLYVDPRVATVEGFVVNGRTYLYFGPLLAVARMPLALFGHAFDGRTTRLSMIGAFAVALFWSRRLLERALTIVHPGPSAEAMVGRRRPMLFAAAVAFSPLLYGAAWTSVYHETEMWSCSLAIVATVLILDLLDRPTNRAAVLAAGATAAVVLTRITVGIGVAGMLAIAAVVLWRRQAGQWRIGAAGAVGGIAASAAINIGKFGSAFGVPWPQQVLSLTDANRAAWFAGNHDSFFSTRFLTTTMLQYLRPDTVRFERLVPFVRFGPAATEHGSYPLESNTPTGSLTATATLLVILAVVGLVWLARRRMWFLLLSFGSLSAGAVAAFAIGFLASRYLIDMLPPLVLAAAVGAWAVPTMSRRRLLTGLGVALGVWGLWSNAALATWAQSLKQPGFTQLRYGIDDAIFGAPSPSLLGAVPAFVRRDGVVVLGTSCSGVYIAEQGHWVALERTQGQTRYTGRVRVPTDATSLRVTGGPGWDLIVATTENGTTLQVVEADGTIDTQAPITSQGAALHAEIVVDRVTNNFSGQVGDAVVFLPGDRMPVTPLDTPGITLDPASKPALCDALRGDLLKDLRARQGIIAATVVGGIWRLVMLCTKWNQKLLLNDSLYYSSQANQNAHGHWFRDVLGQHPGAEHAPLTSLVLTPSSLLPHHEFWQRATNTVLGIAFIPLVGYLVWRIAGRRAAVIAAVVAAVYPNLWMNDNLIMSESLSALFVIGALWLAIRHRDRFDWRSAMWCGAMVGFAALARSEMLLFAPLFALVGLRSHRFHEWIQRAVVLVVAALVVITPWIAYNATRFHQVVLISTNEGGTLRGANCPDTYYGPTRGGWSLFCLTQDVPPPGEDTSDRSVRWRREALSYMRENSGRLPTVIAARVLRGLDLYRLHDLVKGDVGEERPRWAAWAGIASWWVLAPLAAYGWWKRRRGLGWILAVPVITVAFTTVVFYGADRLRISMEPVVVICAAVALAQIGVVQRLGSRLAGAELSQAGDESPA